MAAKKSAKKPAKPAPAKPKPSAARAMKTFGYIDRSGNYAIDPVYELVRPFAGGLAFVKKNAKWSVIDRAGRPVFDRTFDDATEFSESLAAVCVGKKWGYVDTAGKVVVEPRFAEAGEFSEGLARVKTPGSKGKVGFIDTSGNVAVELRWDDAEPFSEGFAAVEEDDAWCFVGRDGQRAFGETDWSSADSFVDGWALVSGEYIDTSGKTVLRPKVGHPWTAFASDRACVDVAKGSSSQSRFGYIDRRGDLVIPATFAHGGAFRDGLALVNRGGRQNMGEVEGGTFAFIDPSGQVVCDLPPGMDDSPYAGLRCGLASFMDGPLVGFVDASGAIVIAPKFKWALAFTEDLCCARG